MNFMIQDLIHPYVQLQNLKPVLFPDCHISDSSKRYALNALVLNVFFDDPDDMLSNIDLEYYTLRAYLQKQDFIIIPDKNYFQLKNVMTFINQKFKSWEMKIPLNQSFSYNEDKIIQHYDDLFNVDKIVNTSLYLAKKFCKTNFDTVTFNYEIASSVGLSLGGP